MIIVKNVSLAALRKQNGITLIVGLILLLVMTMLGLTAIQVTTQQERMAGNLRDRNIAFQAAESALREGESALIRCVIDFSGNGAYDVEANSEDDLVFIVAASTADWTDTAEWPEDSSFLFDDFDDACTEPKTHSAFFQAVAAPRFFLERQPPVGGASLETGVPKTMEVFKVTSRGVGGSVAAVVVLQSSFKKD